MGYVSKSGKQMVDKLDPAKYIIEAVDTDKTKPIVLDMRDYAFAQLIKDLTAAIRSLDDGIRSAR